MAKVRIDRAETYSYIELKAIVRKILDSFPMDYHGKRVAIKPNLLLARAPENASTTHPSLVRAVCEEVIRRGGMPIIAESGGGVFTPASLKKLYEVTGMEQAARDSGALLNYHTKSELFFYPEGKTVREFLIIKAVRDADILINLPKLKTHGLMKMTGAVKNLFGVIPGLQKAMMHKNLPNKMDFASMLCDLAKAICPELTIVDAVVGMEGEGPSGGTPKRCGLLISGQDVFSVDVAACSIMGIEPVEAPVLREAIERGWVPRNADRLDIEGIGLQDAHSDFVFPSSVGLLGLLPGILRYPLEDTVRAYPYITPDCVHCGRCVSICPQEAIKKIEDKVEVNIKPCIRCYCCHEICPQKAIILYRKWRYPKK